MHKNYKKAFTLVELIVVITILAILWTIAFISLQWYSKDTRNSVRLSDMSNINKMLWIKIVTAWKVPVPDNYVEITASGTVLNYQGEAWENVLPVLWISNGWKDPKDETYYTYSTNTNLTKYQLLGFMEWDPIASVVSESFAVSDLSDRAVKVYWDELWIILNWTTNIPVTQTVDVLNTTENYKTTFSEETIVEWTWSELFTHFYNRNDVLLSDKELAKEDDSLVLYMDMETLTWGLLKDFSQYWNNWTLSWGMVYADSLVDWLVGKWLNFTWWFISLWDKESTKISDEITMIVLINMKQWIVADNLSVIWKYGSANPGDLWYNINIIHNYSANYWTVSCWWLCGWSSSLTNLKDGDYYLISMTSDWINWKTFINWNLVRSNYNQATRYIVEQSSTTELRIWSVVRWWTNFHWIIDEVRIYNRALSDNEVQALYNSTK